MKNNIIVEYLDEQYDKKKNLKVILSNIRKEENMKKVKILKMVAVFLLSISLTAGVGYAATVTYQKIFKEPKKYESYEEFENDIENQKKEFAKSQEISNEDKEKTIDINTANEIANKFIENLEYEKQQFVTKELKKNYIVGAELVYYFTTNTNLNKGIHIAVNAENGKVVDFENKDLKYEYDKITSDEITEEEVKKQADKLLKMFELQGEYKIKEIKEMPHLFQNKEVDEWSVTYCKDYDGALSYFERVELSFLIEKGKLKIDSMFIANEDVIFENNPTVITQEEAEKIALQKDKTLTNNQVDFVTTKLEVRGMNSWIYAWEQNGGKYPYPNGQEKEDGTIEFYPKYKQEENIARRVWNVSIHYIQGELDMDDLCKYNTKSIFVDVTTGEIIGGADESYLEK